MRFLHPGKRWFIILYLIISLILTACDGAPAGTPDPHEGMVQVSDGAGGTYWIRPAEGFPLNDYAAEDFSVLEDGSLTYLGTDYLALRGIDVSEHQHEIDWTAAAEAGVDFAILRAGYRGWTEGGLFEDPWFRRNLEGAREAGLMVGCYFFSQAVNADEARGEAEFLLELLDGQSLDLPIYYDWEEIGPDARTAQVDGQTVTDCCLAFRETVEAAGYEAGLYLYRRLGYFVYELDRLTDMPLWVGALGTAPDFHYAHSIWQYSISGRIPGVEGDVDLNLWFIRKPEAFAPETAEPDASPAA
ncbi:MAG: glycoside hydrolase family 25 protein [Eubacteriales bacterium]|nr:glycoside hydrolase family 25 protein [Eubacteriales bacterium]